MQEESIYNLIPKQHAESLKQPLYKSKFSHHIPPTASTFGLQTTSVPKASNIHGEFNEFTGGHPSRSAGATFGLPKGAAKPDTQNFTKKGTGKMGSSSLPPIKDAFKYDKSFKKASVPKKDEKPIMGLKSSKNYILANAVENMLAEPKVKEEPIEWTKKKEYGAVPKYLEKIKEQTQREFEHIRALQQQEEEQQGAGQYLLAGEELQSLREGLKTRWEIVNKDYQLLTYKVMDTLGLRRRKEQYEKELIQIEGDMAKLDKGFILVDARC